MEDVQHTRRRSTFVADNQKSIGAPAETHTGVLDNVGDAFSKSVDSSTLMPTYGRVGWEVSPNTLVLCVLYVHPAK